MKVSAWLSIYACALYTTYVILIAMLYFERQKLSVLFSCSHPHFHSLLSFLSSLYLPSSLSLLSLCLSPPDPSNSNQLPLTMGGGGEGRGMLVPGVNQRVPMMGPGQPGMLSTLPTTPQYNQVGPPSMAAGRNSVCSISSSDTLHTRTCHMLCKVGLVP